MAIYQGERLDLTELITRRSQVQILPPPPTGRPGHHRCPGLLRSSAGPRSGRLSTLCQHSPDDRAARSPRCQHDGCLAARGSQPPFSPGRRNRRSRRTVLPMDARTARKTWRSLEAVHGMIYFTPDAPAAYAAISMSSPRGGYFLSCSMAMGAVSADVVIATFFNFVAATDCWDQRAAGARSALTIASGVRPCAVGRPIGVVASALNMSCRS